MRCASSTSYGNKEYIYTLLPNQALPAKIQRDFAESAQQADGCQLGTLSMARIGFGS
jgi:hypothetical protein